MLAWIPKSGPLSKQPSPILLHRSVRQWARRQSLFSPQTVGEVPLFRRNIESLRSDALVTLSPGGTLAQSQVKSQVLNKPCNLPVLRRRLDISNLARHFPQSSSRHPCLNSKGTNTTQSDSSHLLGNAIGKEEETYITAAFVHWLVHIVLLNMNMQSRKEGYRYSVVDTLHATITRNNGTDTRAGQRRQLGKCAFNELRCQNGPRKVLTRMIPINNTGLLCKYRGVGGQKRRAFHVLPPGRNFEVMAWTMRRGVKTIEPYAITKNNPWACWCRRSSKL